MAGERTVINLYLSSLYRNMVNAERQILSRNDFDVPDQPIEFPAFFLLNAYLRGLILGLQQPMEAGGGTCRSGFFG